MINFVCGMVVMWCIIWGIREVRKPRRTRLKNVFWEVG